MRQQTTNERIQKLVTLSEINLYELDRGLRLKQRFVMYGDNRRLSAAGEQEIYELLQTEESFPLPIIWEGKNGELVGLEQLDEDTFYMSEVQPQEKLVKLLTFLEMLDDILFERSIYQKDIMVRHNVDYNSQGSHVEDVLETDRTAAVYHSFSDEMQLFDAVRHGDKEKVYEYLEKGFIQTFRKTSDDPLTHYRNVCISSITLASRAAIEGGVPATMAYDFGNTMMKQIDKIPTVSQTYAFICSVYNRYTQMVVDEKRTEIPSNITEQCRQYVLAHYKEKVTVQDIADYIGKSPNYVSAIFKEKTGITLSQYINREKISAAQNILKYSDMDVAAVSNFLSFSSQAYFGKVFKELTGMTPKKYKDSNRVKELSFETALKGEKASVE